jgi:hypothetical protein
MIILGHNLDAVSGSYRIRKCSKCNLLVWCGLFENNRFFIKNHPDDVQFNKKLEITCDEYIIKNIIE